MSLSSGLLGLWLAASTVLLLFGFGLNSTARLGLGMWKNAPTANVAAFGGRVMPVTLGIPDVDEELSLSAAFDGSSITPSCGGADLVLTLDPWSPSSMGSILILM